MHEDAEKSSNGIRRQTLQGFSEHEKESVWSLAVLSCLSQIHTRFLCSSRKLGFQVVLWVWFAASFKELCVLELAFSRDWDLNHRMWLRRKKSHLIEVMRKYKGDFALPTVFQCVTLLRFVSRICWSCKLSGVATLFYFVFAECFVQCIPFSVGSYSFPLRWW